MLRLQFNRELAYYAQGILRSVEAGKNSVEEGMKALKDEHVDLEWQAKNPAHYKIGIAAGIIQVMDAPQYFKGGVAGEVYGTNEANE